jgi:hypothetical protein
MRPPDSLRIWIILVTGWLSALSQLPLMAQDLRIGIIGLDTSHSEQFTLRLNDPANPSHIPGARVVVAFPGGSPDIEESKSRVEGFTATVRDKFGVRIVGSVAEACKDVDAILLLSLEGRPRLEQMRQIIAAGKPVFMDKPVAASLKDAVEIYKLAATAQAPVFSASAVRWYPGVLEVANAEKDTGAQRHLLRSGARPAASSRPVLLRHSSHRGALHRHGRWLSVRDAHHHVLGLRHRPVVGESRTGTLHAIHEGAKAYKLIRFGDTQITEQKSEGDYTPMLREIIKFFQTKQAPVSPKQTLEIYAFMEAAEESKRRGGKSVALREVMVKAGAPEAWLPEDGKIKPPPPKSVPKDLPQPGGS